MRALATGEPQPAQGAVLRICGTGSAPAVPGLPVVHVASSDVVASRLLTALEAVPGAHREVMIELDASHAADELSDQRAAVLLLDAVCAVFD